MKLLVIIGIIMLSVFAEAATPFKGLAGQQTSGFVYTGQCATRDRNIIFIVGKTQCLYPIVKRDSSWSCLSAKQAQCAGSGCSTIACTARGSPVSGVKVLTTAPMHSTSTYTKTQTTLQEKKIQYKGAKCTVNGPDIFFTHKVRCITSAKDLRSNIWSCPSPAIIQCKGPACPQLYCGVRGMIIT